MRTLPTGRVTFLFTDLEGSTRFWEKRPDLMPEVYTRHDEILRSAVERHGGTIYKIIGDAVQAAFPEPRQGLLAAVDAQSALLAGPWPFAPAPRVRMALHLVDVAPAPDGDYRTPGLNRLGRLLTAAGGGQILCTAALAREIAGTLDEAIRLVDLGEQQFRDLSPERVFQVFAPGLPAARATLRSLSPHRHNLPQPATSFIGRAGEVADVRRALLDPAVRLFTLVGPGGVGKTRLAIEAASALVDRFSDGVWFASLAEVRDAALVVPTIAAALGIRESIDQTPLDALIAHFSARESLLVLDNLEQIVEAAPAIGALLAASRGLTILATSRSPLGLAGEREFAVPTLASHAAGAPESEAVALFIERARAILPGFTPASGDREAIAAICQRLDGLPLAIELAAARCRLLAPRALLARLEQRLPLLTGGPRDAAARQQTLRATIAWSYDLLDAREKQLFARLALFAGGATLDAVETVCAVGDRDAAPPGSILDTVEALVRQSVLSLDHASGRLRMLETIREFAASQLLASGDEPLLAERHLAFYLDLAEDAEDRALAMGQAASLDLLTREHDNLRAALTRAHQGGHARDLVRLSGALWRFWWIRGHLAEGREWLDRALALAAAETVDGPTLARVLDGAGALADAQGDAGQAAVYHERALALWREAGDRLGQARSLENLGIIALHARGDVARARELHEQAFALFRDAGDRQGIASSLQNLGDAALADEDFARASSSYTRALVIARQLHDTRGIAAGLTSLGVLAFLQGDTGRAIERYEEGLEFWRLLDDLPGIALALGNLGEAWDHAGQPARARPLYEECLVLSRRLGDQ